jgi:hypothetical protein
MTKRSSISDSERPLVTAERALDELVFTDKPSIYVLLASIFLTQAQKEARGEQVQPISPTLMLALRTYAKTIETQQRAELSDRGIEVS